MKSIIIEGSHRSDGNTTIVAQELGKLIKADVVSLFDKQIGHYEYDHKNKDDDFIGLLKHAATHDLVIFATPIYWYSMSGRMKVFLDRITDCLQIEKPLGKSLAGKKLAAISCGSEDSIPGGFFEPFELTAKYLDMNYVGHLHSWVLDGVIPKVVVDKILLFSLDL